MNVAKQEQRKSDKEEQKAGPARPNLNLDFLNGLNKVKEQILHV